MFIKFYKRLRLEYKNNKKLTELIQKETMMKKISFIPLLILLLTFSLNVYAGEGFYMGANIGLSMSGDMEMTENLYFGSNNPQDVELECNSGIALGAAAGYDFGSARIEGELAYQQNDIDKIKAVNQEDEVSGDVSSFALFINGYYDFHNSSKFTPFITAGLGFAKVEIEDTSDNDNDTLFAYHIGAGIGYALTEKVTIESKYRYFATSNFEFENEGEFENNRHNLLFGVRVDF